MAIPKRRTRQALAYIHSERAQRGKGDLDASWFDVAAAYDEGLYSGLHARSAARRAFQELEDFETAESEEASHG